jgi:phenylacetic acid degradation protein
MIFAFKGFTPCIHPEAFVHPQATVIGNVVIAAKVYIGPGAVLRGDWGGIWIEDGANVQENCVVHMFPGKNVYIRKSAHIGHGAIIHGAEVGENALIGMNAVLMDGVVIGAGSIIGALSFVATDTLIPPRTIAVGNPAKTVKAVSDEMLMWKTEGTLLYQKLPEDCKLGLKECEPNRELPLALPEMGGDYQPWTHS